MLLELIKGSCKLHRKQYKYSKRTKKSDKLTQLSQIKEIEQKVKTGGNLTPSDLEVINSINSSILKLI